MTLFSISGLKGTSVKDSHFSISDSLRAHSLRSISSIIRLRFSSWETSLRGGRVASHARLARARSIISTSARPAGKPRPGKRGKGTRHSFVTLLLFFWNHFCRFTEWKLIKHLLTPSLPQPVKFLGWKVHTYTPPNSIFDGHITNLLWILCILIEIFSRAHETNKDID